MLDTFSPPPNGEDYMSRALSCALRIASTNPGTVYSLASISTRRPTWRSVAEVTGPIDASFTPSSIPDCRFSWPTNSTKFFTVVNELVNVIANGFLAACRASLDCLAGTFGRLCPSRRAPLRAHAHRVRVTHSGITSPSYLARTSKTRWPPRLAFGVLPPRLQRRVFVSSGITSTGMPCFAIALLVAEPDGDNLQVKKISL